MVVRTMSYLVAGSDLGLFISIATGIREIQRCYCSNSRNKAEELGSNRLMEYYIIYILVLVEVSKVHLE